jgi:hypothetical protein
MITAQHQLGGTIEDIATVVQKARAFLPTVLNIVEDPAIPALIDRIKILRELEKAARTTAQTQGKPQPGPPGPVGIGLHRFIKPLDYYIKYRQNPKQAQLLAGLGAAGILVLFVGAGVALGHRRLKACPTPQRP